LEVDRITIVLQVNGKVRDRLEIPIHLNDVEVKALALQSEAVLRHTDGKPPSKVIYVPGKLMNIVL
jgi:leucyl-tRNA synthetase